jgi:hypothetical protein
LLKGARKPRSGNRGRASLRSGNRTRQLGADSRGRTGRGRSRKGRGDGEEHEGRGKGGEEEEKKEGDYRKNSLILVKVAKNH